MKDLQGLIVKNLYQTFSAIKELLQDVTLSGPPFSQIKARLSLDGRNLCAHCVILDDVGTSPLSLSEIFYIESLSSDCRYSVEPSNAHITYRSGAYINDTKNRACKIKITHFANEELNEYEEYFYRFLLPIEENFWSGNICSSAYVDTREGSTSIVKGLLELQFPEGYVHVYPATDKKDSYMVVESQMKCTYDKIQSLVYPISLSLGLVTSVAPFDYSFFIACNDKEFKNHLYLGFKQMRETIKIKYNFFTTNMFSLKEALQHNQIHYALDQLYCDGVFNDHFQDCMKMNEFNYLVQMLHEDKKFARATLLLLEVPNKSLEIQGALCSIVLETICSTLENDESFMTNEEWKTNVRPRIVNTIEELANEEIISEDLKINMMNKLNSLNRRTNKDKLIRPFEQVGYILSDNEKEVINDRNIFLHGNIKGKNYAEQYHNLLYASLELQKLCTLLLFRNAGFKGLIVNNAVLFGCPEAIKNKEPVLVK